MWKRTYSVITKEVTKEQLWKLFADVNNWHTWDTGIEYAKMEGDFKTGNSFLLKPKGGPELNIKLLEVVEHKRFLDVTNFPLAKMYDDHIFEETADGLKIIGIITVTGILGFLWRKLVAQNIVNEMPAQIAQQIKFAAKL